MEKLKSELDLYQTSASGARGQAVQRARARTHTHTHTHTHTRSQTLTHTTTASSRQSREDQTRQTVHALAVQPSQIRGDVQTYPAGPPFSDSSTSLYAFA